MIGDIILIIITVGLTLYNVALFPLASLFNWTGILPAFNNAIIWLITPLSYFGYWIDLEYLSIIVILIAAFFTLWFGYQLFRMAWSMKSGNLEQPEL